VTNIVNGEASGLWFNLKSQNTRLRNGEPTAIVLHHTAGEGNAAQVYRTLKNRGLGIHFVIDSDGKITQMADWKKVVVSHAGSINGRSIGIEIVNRGVPPAILGHKREVYMHNFRGKDREFLKFHPAQVEATWELLKHLSKLSSIPLVFPEGENVLDKVTQASYNGVLGHHHLVLTKIDPSPHVWAALRAYVGQH
jgi:N-acetyl-anhydromuramyl-L-alanine amidase AmpD